MAPVLSASIAAFGLSFAVAAVAPAPRRPRRGDGALVVVLLCLAGLTGSVAVTLPFLDLWQEGAALLLLAFAVALPSFWLARWPDRPHPDEGEEGSDGGGGRPPTPDLPAPPAPDGHPPALDWSAFDDVRAGWAQGDRERVPAGV
jgi:hypothetical protein